MSSTGTTTFAYQYAGAGAALKQTQHPRARAQVQRNSLPVRIGAANTQNRNNAGSHWHGGLDDVAFFASALSEREVQRWMLGRPVRCARTVCRLG